MASSDLQHRLSRFWILSQLDQEELRRTAEFVHEETAPAGRVLFRQGQAPTHFYLLERGVIQETGIDSAGKEILNRRVEPGDDVGRWGVLHGQPQRSTATVVREASLLSIENKDFQTLLAMVPRLRQRLERKNVVNRLWAIPLFASFNAQEITNVADLVREVDYPAGQTIFGEGDEADAFYVIDVGQVEETSYGLARGRESLPRVMTAGHFFGRHALLHNTTRRATARAITNVNLFRFSAEAFHWLRRFKPGFDDALAGAQIEDYLRATRTFEDLDDIDLRHLAGYTGLAHLRTEEALYRQGETDPTLYILYEGEAIARERDPEGRERPRSYFESVKAIGESSLFLAEPRDVTVVATTASNWCYLTKADLDRFLQQYPDVKDKLALKKEVKERQTLKRLPWMEPAEQLVLRRRCHWVFLAVRLVLPLSLLLFALMLVLIGRTPVVGAPASALGLMVALVALLWGAWRLVDWFNDYYYVTTMRVAHQEKTLWVRETRDEALMSKVQNVNTSQGVFGNFFGFGGLVIDTAAQADVSRVTFKYVPDPVAISQLILRQMHRLRAGEAIESYERISETLGTRVDLGLQPSIPRPVIPVDEPPPAPVPQPVRIARRLGEATWKPLFWVERREADQVTWRKHPFRLLAVTWLPLLAVTGTLGLLALSLAAGGSQPFSISILLIGLLLASLFWLWWNWANWGNDLYIVTNDRIIDRERLPLGFRSQDKVTTFDKVQNVSYEIPGPIATFFDYGTVTIFTAGAEGKLDFVWVKNPRHVQQELFQRLRRYEDKQRRRQSDELWKMLPEWFAAYDRSRRP
jgi:CRP-like cAMP-binding protein